MTATIIDQLEKLIEAARYEGIGWMDAEACGNLDNGVDTREVLVPDIMAKAKKELSKQK
jgi:hypothetical protein